MLCELAVAYFITIVIAKDTFDGSFQRFKIHQGKGRYPITAVDDQFHIVSVELIYYFFKLMNLIVTVRDNTDVHRKYDNGEDDLIQW